MLSAVRQSWRALRLADRSMAGDKAVMLECVAQQVSRPRSCKSLVSLGSHGRVSSHAFRGRFLSRVVTLRGLVLSFLCLPEHVPLLLLLRASAAQGVLLSRCSVKLRQDKDVVGAAVAQDWHAILHASKRLKNSKPLLLRAVASGGYALKHASPALRDDKEVTYWHTIQPFHTHTQRERTCLGCLAHTSCIPLSLYPWHLFDLLCFL